MAKPVARPLMIQGCTSDAGKSYLAAGFCRLYANRGLKVAPFKAQNMSNNAGVTPDGGEMGRAQLLQAQAARVTPDVRMNPVLLKPEADTRSQVVLLGKARRDLSEVPWLERKQHLWDSVQSSLHTLRSEYDLIVIEGAGSPAEVNLKAGDIVNMRVAKEVNAAVLLASDIDRGGSFAHLLGTWHCFEPDEQELLIGFLLNKFRGDPALLGNAMDWLEERTGVPTLGVIPMLRLPLPEEDAFSLKPQAGQSDKPCIAIILTPYISNFDEFDALLHEDAVTVQFVKEPAELTGVDAVILAGSKQVAHDLEYLKTSGFAAKIHALAERGIFILGICGGLQMLGKTVADPHGVEGEALVKGLGLLELKTEMAQQKTTRQTSTRLLPSGYKVSGYEIHHGQTLAESGVKPYLADELGFINGNVAGVYVHGLFDNASFRAQVLKQLGVLAQAGDWAEQVDASLDVLAQHLEDHCDMDVIDKVLFR